MDGEYGFVPGQGKYDKMYIAGDMVDIALVFVGKPKILSPVDDAFTLIRHAEQLHIIICLRLQMWHDPTKQLFDAVLVVV